MALFHSLPRGVMQHVTGSANTPDFSSVNENNETVRLADFKNRKNIVLYFYPKDDTPVALSKPTGLPVDTSAEVCEAYGVWQEKEKHGVMTMGIVRSTFIIDKQGKIIDAEYGVAADGHALAVLDKIKQR
jgi:peroxiredoxin